NFGKNLGKDLSSSDKRDTRRELFEEKTRIEEESLESSKETLGLILESERIGVKTGRELVRQRETLNRVEDKLESIDGSLHETQKHIKSMKKDNLNQIDLGIERLKQLSLGLGNEIDEQNTLIDRITKQTEKTELRIKHQNHQVNHLLRK
ncbi:unnamed protein product, partial [Oppiella nova]